ncbi:uncharacterized protein BDZ99DRAFT_461527 [Mytilinidion resinicola]|uniref:Uncharacterized protein n=1 Tax=Mytilinidion resinicola TaxID=574789 RepID=A0A6A6YRR3_9PEZI|nr:uncharacterized protein BDZ99DRAFT_461527 [Mytilinidion resinicola]KAF2811461.1 hypothetical protein BDZ99DRAFT_461527 [Mytilinidion resinicola]
MQQTLSPVPLNRSSASKFLELIRPHAPDAEYMIAHPLPEWVMVKMEMFNSWELHKEKGIKIEADPFVKEPLEMKPLATRWYQCGSVFFIFVVMLYLVFTHSHKDVS